jgi:hypothetical protein
MSPFMLRSNSVPEQLMNDEEKITSHEEVENFETKSEVAVRKNFPETWLWLNILRL